MYKSTYSDHITVYSDSDKSLILQKAKEELNELFEEYHGLPLLFMSSGGSCLKLLNGIKDQFLDASLTITTLDERFSTDPSINNFAQITETSFYKKAISKKCNIIDTRIQDETVEDAASRFEFELRHILKLHPETIIIATLGMGKDGHTAGIIPGLYSGSEFDSFFEGGDDKWIAGYDKRITPTFYFLKNCIKHAEMFVSGGEKKNALDRVLEGEGSLEQTPALIIKEMKDVELFTDI